MGESVVRAIRSAQRARWREGDRRATPVRTHSLDESHQVVDPGALPLPFASEMEDGVVERELRRHRLQFPFPQHR